MTDSDDKILLVTLWVANCRTMGLDRKKMHLGAVLDTLEELISDD